MKFFVLAALIGPTAFLLHPAHADSAPALPPNHPVAQTKLRLDAAAPKIQVEIDGQGPFDAIIDSGSTYCAISPKLAARLGLTSYDGPPVVDAYGQSYSDQAVSLDSVGIGNATLANCTARVGVLGRYDVVIGADLFVKYVVTLDFKDKQLQLYDPAGYIPHASHRLGVAVQPGSNMGIFTGTIDGIPTTMAFDSGSVPFVRITGGPVADWIRQSRQSPGELRTKSYSGKKVADNYKLQDLTVGDDKFPLASVFTATIPHGGGAVADNLAVFVSLQPFQDSCVTFDYPSQAIYFDEEPARVLLSRSG